MSARCFGVFVPLAFTCASALAQDTGLSAQDLKASYCFGYFTEQGKARRQVCEAPISEAMASICRDGGGFRNEQADKLRRVEAYLRARDILLSIDEAGSTGFTMSKAQGESDFRQCLAWVGMRFEAHTQSEQACMSDCRDILYSKGRSRADAISQYLKCAWECEPEVCKTGRTCESMDYLPW